MLSNTQHLGLLTCCFTLSLFQEQFSCHFSLQEFVITVAITVHQCQAGLNNLHTADTFSPPEHHSGASGHLLLNSLSSKKNSLYTSKTKKAPWKQYLVFHKKCDYLTLESEAKPKPELLSGVSSTGRAWTCWSESKGIHHSPPPLPQKSANYQGLEDPGLLITECWQQQDDGMHHVELALEVFSTFFSFCGSWRFDV